MYIIDVTLKSTPVTLSVQRKSEEDAKALYNDIKEALKSGSPAILEMTCEQQVGKQVSVLTNEISAVQMSEKSSTTAASGRPPGFFALTAES